MTDPHGDEGPGVPPLEAQQTVLTLVMAVTALAVFAVLVILYLNGKL